ncbi:rare lipoprotein A [Flavobacterium akiainvivens]|nr:rare lipoprotein A [Flavobacterium akiainvivens]
MCLLTIAIGCGSANHIGSSGSKGFTSYSKSAKACYYADKYNGNKTANGETFSNSKYTAAHKKLAFGTRVKVTNKANGKSVIVTINDRGPFSGGFDIDLTKKAFMEISDNKNSGSMDVSLEVAK